MLSKLIRIFKMGRSTFYTSLAKIQVKNFSASIRVNGYCKFTPNCTFGDNVNFNGLKVLGNGKCKFGNNFHSGFGCTILTSFHNYKGSAIPYDTSLITQDVIIEENVWIGINVTILGGVTIGEGAIVQAGSVVVNNIPPLSIAGGHPARVFSKRDHEHYFKLKGENKVL